MYLFVEIVYFCAMKKVNLLQPYEIVYLNTNQCPLDVHGHSFFELLYILSGSGTQNINGNVFGYRKGDFFLITPKDHHAFDVETKTEFFIVRFHENHINSDALSSESAKRLKFILNNADKYCGCILKNKTDIQLIRPIVEAILNENEKTDLYDKEFIRQLVNTLIIIAARNLSLSLPETINNYSDSRIMEIIHYIHSNIHNPEKLIAKNISSSFSISELYLGRYFKKHTGVLLQQYIINYKLSMIESRLLYSDMRINEIANEFGFTDESHLYKLFKKYRGLSPGSFRLVQNKSEEKKD
ncbi:AraC family L-rhamnose operon transcriptional activator RhaR [Parabacteroides sp. PF5-5]|nr:AraC family L-rhamnose operon transcriptional activator RhaR [Parabacteroides sp. PH5-39]MDH6317895.1 AraC family L-rhamnose operon transcriptional activator RhaR [Parabacteroides sp. PF5-13]MDH6321398.1 AraC family L-rhamnose operon transcriptional activator RhaR [Parabacteroides sp. PH5-13]MDH6325130.1 AraC family L-rhamnose operon transcriptional activator RhaR [Parabacteroides sp. PH5-8]MDH6327432.1 AraC family L-rhamnose operon transcriptional activator RhaR [Parabacteroides sp. PH5-41]